MPATASQNPCVCTMSQPSVAITVPSWPALSVTWRASTWAPSISTMAGPKPSIRPNDTLAAMPETLRCQNPAQRNAPRAPNRCRARRL
ncbi:hypothetical protein D3C73_1251950 [compost metagenome]